MSVTIIPAAPTYLKSLEVLRKSFKVEPNQGFVVKNLPKLIPPSNKFW